MVAPLVTGALIGAGASLLGGLMGRREARRQEELQREFAQHGIRWRVEDAKAAGVHPLFALGGGGATYSPTLSVDPMAQGMAQAGQEIGRAVGMQQTQEQRELARWQLEVLKSQVNESDARQMAIYSQIARDAQAARSATPMPSGAQLNSDFLTSVQNPDVRRAGVNEVKVNPSEATSFAAGDRAVEAATTPSWKRYTYEDSKGQRKFVYLPGGNSITEALEPVSESWMLQWMVLQENMRRNPNFLREAQELLPLGGVWAWLEEFMRADSRRRSTGRIFPGRGP